MVNMQNEIASCFIHRWKQRLSDSTKIEAEEEIPTELISAAHLFGSRWTKVFIDKLRVKDLKFQRSGYQRCVVQANHPVPANRFLYYFEMYVVNAGAKGQISIGFIHRDVPMSRHPGCRDSRLGYHGDDGMIHFGCYDEMKQPFGPTYTCGDTVGAGIVYEKNGVLVGGLHNTSKNKLYLYPSVAVQNQNEEITVNFGQQPFVFDVKAFETQERTNQLIKIESETLHQDVCYGIVRSYLVHCGYAHTLELFDSASPSFFPPITPIQGNDFNDRDNDYALQQRKSLRQLIKTGDIDGAFQNLRDWYPNVVQDDSSACFLLCCQKYIELAREGKVMEAITYGKMEFNRYFEMQSRLAVDFEDLTKECIAVLAYNEPEKSRLGYLMEDSQREFVADAINALILSTNPKVNGVKECLHPCLESLLKQLIACYTERMTLNKRNRETFNLSQILDNFK